MDCSNDDNIDPCNEVKHSATATPMTATKKRKRSIFDSSEPDGPCESIPDLPLPQRPIKQLKRNDDTQTDKRTFKCDWKGCDYASCKSGNLARHKRHKHTGEKPHKCDQCNYTSCGSGDLVSHKRRKHTGEKPCKCDQCDYACCTSDELARHKRRKHTGEKPFKCDWTGCNYASCDSGHLVIHKRHKHTGEKPYKCDRCDYAFCDSGGLASHKRRKHTGEKPYKCDQCDYAFCDSGNLAIHKRRKHTGEKPYKCDQCDYASCGTGEMKRHKKSMHTEEGQKKQKRKENRFALELKKNDIPYDPPGFHLSLECIGGTFVQPDFVNHQIGFKFWIEYDEGQHKHYPISCDAARMLKIIDALFVSGQDDLVYFLRISTDPFTVDGKKSWMKYSDIIRLAVKLLKNYKPVFAKGQRFKVGYIGYDMHTTRGKHPWPVVCSDPDYPNEVAKVVECFNVQKA